MILVANGQRIVDSDDVPELIDKASPGDRIALEVWRKGAKRLLVAALDELTDVALLIQRRDAKR